MNQARGNPAPLPIRAIDVIRRKRDGEELSRAEIEYLVRAYTIGEIPDYQASAWLMAVILRGLCLLYTSPEDRRLYAVVGSISRRIVPRAVPQG